MRPIAIFITLLCAGLNGQAGPGKAPRESSVSIVPDAALGRASRYGVETLQGALRARGWAVQIAPSAGAATGQRIVIAGTTSGNGAAVRLRREAGLTVPSAAESLAVRNTQVLGKPTVVLCGADDRGLMYAALDAADRIGWATDPANPFSDVHDVEESPFVVERSLSVYTMNRAYWESRFYDERYWARYLDTLAASRFNRFLIVFGYENGGFLAPSYPYFFDTPGFPGVRMVGLTEAQQQRNLAALNRLIEMAHDRGIAVGLGLWDHIYRAGVQTGGAEWVGEYKDRPVPNSVQGLTADNLSAYTLASLKRLLTLVPQVDSLQFRVHEESGLKREEMEGFWRAVFRHVQHERPGMLLEARAKGTPDSIIEAALALGVNLRVETKFWMEQMGLPFHPTHVNPPNQRDRRHGYADLLRYPQRYRMNWRLWNGGTSRVLLWGDPDYVRRYSRSTLLYDSPNWDVNEPLATKMEAQRPDAAPFDLLPGRYRYYDYEFERYWHFFQVWGRLGYNPDTPAEIWQRPFQRRFGAAAPHVEAGLHRASQVLPMIVASVYPYGLFPTTRGWAERQSLGATLAQYARNEGSDVQQFENFAEAARRIVAGGVTPRRTPEATSRWFDETAGAILASVAHAEAAIGGGRGNEFDSTIADLRILANLARFHARRSVAAVRYNVFGMTGDVGALEDAIAGERAAIEAWRDIVLAAGDRYVFDLAMGACNFDLCGHWRDELVKLEAGFARLEQQRHDATPSKAVAPASRTAGRSTPAAAGPPPRVEHEPIRTAPPGQPLRISAHVTAASGVQSVRLRYRHVTQFEDYETLDMQPAGAPGSYAATVPAGAISPQWDFMYFIEAIDAAGNGTMWPDLAKDMPYVIVNVQRSGVGIAHGFQSDVTRNASAAELALQIADYASLPITGSPDGSGNNAGSLARVNFLREEPAPARRFFVNDLNGPLYILDRTTKTLTTYLDLNGHGTRSGLFHKLPIENGLASGFISFQFDPDYARNGRFYTIHLEDLEMAGSLTPDNTSVPGLDVTGYTPTPAVPTPGEVDHEAVLIEWTDSNIANSKFEGTARELLRVRLNSRIHPMGDLIFNPVARRGDPDWRVLYVACGDGGSGEQKTAVRLNPQRLDTLVGKILRIIPDLAEHADSSTLGENGRYRIPRDNPFVSTEGARKEIWAYGLRNPHRLSWDVDPANHANNNLIAAVIGVHTWETVVIIHKGANYGYSEREGTQRLLPDNTKDNLPDVDTIPVHVTDAITNGTVAPKYPVLEYGHGPGGGDAIAGGFVYRGTAAPELAGKYIFGDISTGRLWYADYKEMLVADVGNRMTLAEIHELPIWWDDPADVPDRGAQLYPTMFPVVESGYHARGGKAPGLPGRATVSGTGRVDLRLAVDSAGELYLLSKSDGMIRAVTGVVHQPRR